MGFTDIASHGTMLNGIGVLTEKSFLFLQWNDLRYVPVKRIPTTDIVSVTLDSWGLARRIFVIRLVRLLGRYRRDC
jgi:hypothetical protein